MTVFVCNGWAAGPETWELTTFHRDWTFDYIEQMDGLPERIIADFDEVVLIGFSMGSTTALRLLTLYPGKVKGLVLVSATPRMLEEKKTINGVTVKVWEGFSHRRLEAFRVGTEFMFREDPSPIYDPKNLERGLKYLEDTDLRGNLANLAERNGDCLAKLPVAIFHSRRDGIVRPGNVEYLKGLFPRATVTWVEGNEHVLPVKVPELISAAVEGMLSK